MIFHIWEDASEITTLLIAHPAVKKINFTGSTSVGSVISSTAGKYLKLIMTELGGKASVIVLKDADVEKAAQATVAGAFLHAGQICMATEHVIVHHAKHDKFVKALTRSTDSTFS